MIIRVSNLVNIRAFMCIYHLSVTMRKNRKTELLGLLYEPEAWNGLDNELTTQSELISENILIKEIKQCVQERCYIFQIAFH